ncbi:acyl-CoA-binding domain-containing protein 5-B isoform X6 [Clarias gariepinus]|uniref:acyl-CoA-binding domain-containing protein 5-B isoform X6 n=1 Tax=Clarias gariepinus TaxID=13013 RepID=UPI00234D10F1|nr:acyl-CoA-binding domain-containing protein 5-B isoform X6 [Clarias gariepinus]
MENYSSSYQRRFEAAVKVMKTLPEDGALVPSEDMLVTLYAHHKQATVGVCPDSTEPRGRDALSKAKWKAWKALGDMSKEAAMKAYVEEILLILEMIPVTEEVCDLLEVLETFYEVVEDEDEETTSKPATSAFTDTDMTRLTVANRAERGGSPVCTHGSLNTEEDEEEKEHRRETSHGSPEALLQQLPDDCLTDGGDVSDPGRPSEVYSDLVRAEEGSGGRGAAEARAKTPEGRGRDTAHEGVSQDGRPHGAARPPLCTAAHGPVQSVIESAGRAGGEGFNLISGCRWTGESVSNIMTLLNEGTVGSDVTRDSVDTQITEALSRLQDDMRSVLAKVNTLEARAELKVKSLALRREPHTDLSYKRLSVSPSVVSQMGFLFVWPFVTHFLMQIYLKRKKRG